MIRFIENIGDYFATNYFDEDFPRKVFDKSGYAAEDLREFNKRISALKDRYYRYKQTFLEERLRPKDRITITHEFHQRLLQALGYPGDRPQYDHLYHLTEKEVLPVRHILYRGERPHLFVMEMQAMIQTGEEEPKGLFEQQYFRAQWENVFQVREEGLHITPSIVNEAVSQLFLLEQDKRPHYILMLAGNELYLLQYEKWFRGSYLRFRLEDLFDEASRQRDYYSLFYFLLGKETLAPASDIILMEQLDEDSHKSAYAVTKDLKEGVIYAVEALANEAVWYMKQRGVDLHGLDENFAQELKDDCLTLVYRLLFLFYAESRPDLEIIPISDEVYQRGYSLEMLRDLEQAPLHSEHARNSYFFHQSLHTLFQLLSGGYRERESQNGNKSFRLRHLDSPLFDDEKLHHLRGIRFRNFVWQEIIGRLSLSRQQRGRTRGRISYANLGVNQLGSVYEGLLAYRGFFAEQDYIEVHRKKKPEDGTYLAPRTRLDEFKTDEILHDEEGKMVIHPRGSFIYRLSGRDRQKSASYYTPEVLTQTTVKYTLKPLLDRFKNEKGEWTEANEILRLKILETAMGAAAFHNEAINQLAEAYLDARQAVTGKRVPPGDYQEELQKIKAYIATNNVYGVDLNPTAVELGKLALWLNVIHRDMETPFFGYRLGVGNAAVGAWLKVYRKKDILYRPLDRKGKRYEKKEWWTEAPRLLAFKSSTPKPTDRKPDEIYHFLLPDANMVPSANIKLLRKEHSDAYEHVKEWRKDFLQPIRAHEYQRLQAICRRIDALLAEHYRFQARVNACTTSRVHLWGGYDPYDQCELDLHSYDEKDQLARNRYRTNAPYFKLKMVMDYWCALWYWDLRQAHELPTRAQWYDDLVNILDIDLEAELSKPHSADEAPASSVEVSPAGGGQGVENPKTPNPETGAISPAGLSDEAKAKSDGGRGVDHPKPQDDFQIPTQGDLFGAPKQLTLSAYRRQPERQQAAEALIQYGDRQDRLLFPSNRRRLVEQYARRYRFFHYHLEFIEVFTERGGFDLIVGNPPWIKIEFEEKGIVAEKRPEVLVRKTSAPKVRKMLGGMLQESPELKEVFLEEALEHEGSSESMNAVQNYPLLQGQQTNLYKCIIENSFSLIREEGFIGLVHPQGIYDDPKGQKFREEIYQRLQYHFQFRNQLMLFPDIGHRVEYGIHIYAGRTGEPDFYLINNLFHPVTVDGCFVHDGVGLPGGIKVVDKATGNYEWNLHPHADRKIRITPEVLQILARTFEDSDDWPGAKLVSIHSRQIVSVLEKLSRFPGKVADVPNVVSEGWHETNAQDKGIIRRETRYPDLDKYELIYSGPHFFVGQPLYKTPREVCTEKADYGVIDLTRIPADYLPRTNFLPDEELSDYKERIKGFKIASDSEDESYDNFLDHYKLIWSRMVSLAGERSLQAVIGLPRVAHVNTVNSLIFRKEENLIELAGLLSSVVYDFFIKTIGKGDIRGSNMLSLPMGVSAIIYEKLALRTLLLNALTRPYAPLWRRHWRAVFREDRWASADPRLKDLSALTEEWTWETPLRNYYERRWALVEIDVLTAMALGLTLEELILIYRVQFPVLQQNEDDTWYDRRGNIVFTCSRGLTGVGLDRKEWEHVRDLRADGVVDCSGFENMSCNAPGEITYTITKSELYRGEEVTYYAPFAGCDRVEDYELVWGWFEQLFNSEK